jgi:hypothetical protein
LLKNNGVFISITFAQPHFRKPMYALDKYNWSIELYTIGETFHYFVYVMTKGKQLNEEDKYTRFKINSEQHLNTVELKADLNENFLLEIQID